MGETSSVFRSPSEVCQPATLSETSQINQPSRGSQTSEDHNQITASLSDQRILLVDDDDDTVKILAEVLQRQGAIVEVARSAREAIEVLDRFQADVIVSDLTMPDDDGYSLIQMIRAREAGERRMAHAIALTALVQPEHREPATSAGFNIFLPKPVEPNDVVSAIENLTAAA